MIFKCICWSIFSDSTNVLSWHEDISVVSTLQAWKLCRAKPETGWTTVKNGGKLTMKTHRHRNEVNIIVYLKYEYLRQLFFFFFSLGVLLSWRWAYSACVFNVLLETEKDVCYKTAELPDWSGKFKGPGHKYRWLIVKTTLTFISAVLGLFWLFLTAK